MKKTIIAAALSLFSIAAVVAQPGKLKDENRQIQKGVISGRITRSELNQLKAEEARLRADIYRYKRDGRLSAWERSDLAMKEKALSRNIYLQTHDRQVRY